MKLEGIRVLDLSRFLPGPHLAMIMADHGADVIKVEDPRAGEPTRQIGPRMTDGHGTDQTVYFRNTQRGKRSLTLDLKHPEGREILLRLAERSDVLLESFRPGVMARLGLDAATVRERAPRLVYCSISAFGQDGPMRERPAHDLSVQAHAGVAALTADSRGRPVVSAMPAADMLGSQMALSGILMALLRRHTTGRGDTLDISMFDSVLAWTPHATPPVFAEGRAPIPAHERTMGGAALYQVYATSDGRYITLGGSEAKFARNLLTALGREDLIEAATRPAGPAQQPVKDFLTETFARRTQAEWVDWFRDKDVCFGAVRDLTEAFADPMVRERGMLLEDEAGTPHIGPPHHFAEEPARPRFHAPEPGEHTAAILDELGYDAARIGALRDAGVI